MLFSNINNTSIYARNMTSMEVVRGSVTTLLGDVIILNVRTQRFMIWSLLHGVLDIHGS